MEKRNLWKKMVGMALFSWVGLGLPAQTAFDAHLADSLGADEYGMKSYMLVLLKTGPKQEPNKAISDSLFSGHMANIQRLAEEGWLVVAGPVGKNDLKYRGIFILNVTTEKEAKTLLQTDPAVQYGLLDADILPWYGSAALPLYLPYHEKVQKTSF